MGPVRYNEKTMTEREKREGEVAESRAETPDDARHAPHKHARPRVLWGVAAVFVVAVGTLAWFHWGDAIRRSCVGGEGACPVDLSDVPKNGVHFDKPAGFE